MGKTLCLAVTSVVLVLGLFLIPVDTIYGQEEAVETFGNFIAVGTGRVKDGEQIPSPYYQDGKQALRSEVHYFVSPSEVPTSLSYINTIGAFYVKCSVDLQGYAHISLWQQTGTGEGVKVVGADTYERLKAHFTTEGVTSPTGAENVTVAQMKVLSERLVANYLVIALRSLKK